MEDATTSGSGILPGSAAPAELARPIAEALAAGDGSPRAPWPPGLEAPDLADLIELLEPDQRVQLVQALGPAFDPEVLPELDETVRDQLSRGIAQGRAGTRRRRARDRRCRLSPREPREGGPAGDPGADPDRRPRRARAQPGISRGDRRPSHADGLRGGAAVLDGRARSSTTCARREDLPDTFSDIYVVDPTYHVLGSVDLSRLLRTKREVQHRRHHGCGPPGGAGHRRPGGGGAPVRALRPEVGAGGRRQQAAGRRRDRRRRGGGDRGGDRGGPAAAGRRRRRERHRQRALHRAQPLRVAVHQPRHGAARLLRDQGRSMPPSSRWWRWPC